MASQSTKERIATVTNQLLEEMGKSNYVFFTVTLDLENAPADVIGFCSIRLAYKPTPSNPHGRGLWFDITLSESCETEGGLRDVIKQGLLSAFENQ
ncbi:MAG: hypothetical protein JNJ50_16125 [Acidobacteria bacterium]|nr:hypothetical protein [Acidobacteriota bacterium]